MFKIHVFVKGSEKQFHLKKQFFLFTSREIPRSRAIFLATLKLKMLNFSANFWKILTVLNRRVTNTNKLLPV